MGQPPRLSEGASVDVLRTLSHLARQLLLPSRAPQPAFDLVVRQAAESLGGDAASLYLCNAEGDFELTAVHGRPFEHRRIPKDQGVVGEVGRRREVVAIEDIRRDPRYATVGRAHQEGFVSMVAAPLMMDHELLGVLGVYWAHHRLLSPAELELVQLLAHYAAGAVALARLVTELDRSNRRLREANARIAEAARRDPLTGVFNRAVFWAALEHLTGERPPSSDTVLLERIALPQPPAAVFMIDLNGFKEFNDAHGHLAGDTVLQEIATLLQGLCGSSGLVARYGGDEFGMLVGVSGTAPDEVTQAIRRTISGHAFAGGQRLDPPSVGHAVYPEEARTARELVALADSRMYRQKPPRVSG
ncbi:sensor domain-containing diguanylate cyclase [Geochorda subterranea]|uniref:Sensor domain-containing diguanylate cyclase n=1 Tax=Geochorda subterranea TaxID=3109564 RepID=A0ABZ1BRS6_9FIRM|nr:sensor domain-containing diguanylate cyclase [Limnochorda sp. LNt]WRP14908.1 sensor domain-containing diguanylate cyclase [Limnochorda sp. LNt]